MVTNSGKFNIISNNFLNKLIIILAGSKYCVNQITVNKIKSLLFTLLNNGNEFIDDSNGFIMLDKGLNIVVISDGIYVCSSSLIFVNIYFRK